MSAPEQYGYPGRCASPVNCKRESGIALLILVVIVILTFSTVYLTSVSVTGIRIDEAEQTRKALNEARRAIIDYAAMHASGAGNGDPGEYAYLPCPYIVNGNDGAQEGLGCGAAHQNAIGLLPWVSLGIDALRDASGNCLWYAVSGSYKNDTHPGMINPDSNGMLQVADEDGNIILGNALDERAVAIVFAPGDPVNGQNRVYDPTLLCGSNGAQVAEFLDDNASVVPPALLVDNSDVTAVDHNPDAFLHATVTMDPDIVNAWNDQFVVITRDDIWQRVYETNIQQELRTLTQAMAECLAAYAGHGNNTGRKLPWPAPLAAGDYRDNNDYGDVNNAALGYTGRLPIDVSDSNAESGIGGVIASVYFNTPGLCTNLVGNTVDLTDANGLYRNLYENYKDHFFYALSDVYEPDAGGVYTNCATAGSNCVTVNDGAVTEYAAIVIFGGRAGAGQPRVYDDLGANDDKLDANSYLESGNGIDNAAQIMAGTVNFGIGPDPVNTSDDIMYCLTDTDPPLVQSCNLP